MADQNLVKYGIKNVTIFPITAIDTTKTDGTAYTYGTPFALPGAQTINLSAQWASNTIYADDIAYAEQTANLGYDGTLQNVKINAAFEQQILGWLNGQENADTIPKSFGLAFQFTGDKNNGRIMFYHVDLTKAPDIVHNTKTNSLSNDSDSMSIKVKPRLDTHDVKLKQYPGDTYYDTLFTTVPNPLTVDAGSTAIAISGDDTVAVSDTITLTATTSPIAGQAVTWSSLDGDNATVTSGGVVSGVAAGTATIKAALTSDSSVFTTKTITVTSE